MLNIAINGYGRIGDMYCDAWVERGCPAPLRFVLLMIWRPAQIHLTRYDATHGHVLTPC